MLRHLCGLLVGKFVKERETHETVAIMVAIYEGGSLEAVLVIGTAMEGKVMEGGLDATVAEDAHEAGAELKAGADEIVHVAVVGGIIGDVGQTDAEVLHLSAEDAVVNLPDTNITYMDTSKRYY